MLLIKEASKISKSTQNISIALGYPPQLHVKTVLLNIMPTLAAGHILQSRGDQKTLPDGGRSHNAGKHLAGCWWENKTSVF